MGIWKGKWGWATKFEFQGRQHKREGFKTKDEAAAWMAAEKRRLRNLPRDSTPTTSFAGLATRYVEHCKARMQQNTWRAKQLYFIRFLDFLHADPPIDSITKIQLLDFLESIRLKLGNKNANRHRKDIKALFTWGALHDLVKANPVKAIQPFPEERTIKYVPPAEDIDKVLMAANQEEMDLLICIYHTGGRIGEILKLAWEDVNFEKKSITLWTRKRRGGQLEPDPLAIGAKLLDVLMRRWGERNKETPYVFHRKDGKPYTYDGKPRRLMGRLCEKAGVKSFGYHAIRHHVASIIADSGKATLGQIQKFLRHRRQATTEGYLHELTRDQKEIADILDGEGEKGEAVQLYGISGKKGPEE